MFLFLVGCDSKKQIQHPNVLILYADDLGWSDLGCYGSIKNETPHIDQLASEGLRFTQAYAPAPICSASRASIMTGKSPARLNFEFVSTPGRITDKPLLPPKRTLDLPLEEVTLGEIAQSAGYKTAFFGKWHISRHNDGYLKWSDTHGPFQPYDKKNQEPVELPEGSFPEDTLVLKALDFLKKQQQDQPFFMFFSSYYVHTPVISNNSWLIEKYRTQMPAASENEIKYAAFVETMDHYFGQLLNVLQENGLKENTLIIFTSDNGGHPAYTDNDPLRGNKWNLYEGGIREPLIVSWSRQTAKLKRECLVPVIQWDLLPTLCDILDQPVPNNVEGESLLPLFTGRSSKLSREAIYWHFPFYHPPISYEGTTPCSALRSGKYKLVYFYEDQRGELYNLENDPMEKIDLSSEMPELAARLKITLLKRLNDLNARFPVPNPDYIKGIYLPS
jgi:uncharacterized sulfatase